ncbi:hypothetical protein KC19_12G144500 [Ceratodon purpureus]|uniref:Roc domain-containing protein n=1 Tax=Ceratodon purpureus TaxID=3225 RepID=A0A8T0G8G8_CERPU|nr:hypothetical protein KC19_12G144500 [Ceratodon purpureus]
MEDCDRLHPPGWWRQFKPPDYAKSNEEILRPFYAALEACPPDTKLHCTIKLGLESGDSVSVELSGIDKNAQGQSYWEQCMLHGYDFEPYRPHGTGKTQPMTYTPDYRSVRFSGDEWASIVNAVTKCPVLEELEIQVYGDIDPLVIVDLLNRQSALRVLGLRILDRGESNAQCIPEVAESIRKMKTLEKLVLFRNHARWDEILLQHLFPSVSSPSVSQTEDQSMLKELLWIYDSSYNEKHHYEVVITLLRNSRLKTIELLIESHIGPQTIWSYQDLIGVFETLQGNKHLKKLGMDVITRQSWSREDGKGIIGKLLDLVGHDFYVEEIRLPIDLPDEFKRVEDQVKKNVAVALEGMELISPESSRVFLCGRPYAGKTQLRTTFGKEKPAFFKGYRKHKKIPRTSGIEVESINTKVAKLSFWDFGGQVDYHFLHDLFIPSNCESGGSFVILCSLVANDQGGKVILKDGRKEPTLKEDEAIEEELVYWLRFIVSNSKMSEKFKPFITLVFTHADLVPKEQVAIIQKSVEDIVKKLKLKFGNSIQFLGWSSIDARSEESVKPQDAQGMSQDGPSIYQGWSFIDATSRKSVKPLLKGLAYNAQKMLQHGPRVYRVCVEVEKILMQWNKDNPQTPLIKMSKFEELFKKSPMSIQFKKENKVQDICKAIAVALHDSGNVIYFDNLNSVVVKPNWFCHDIMGRILTLDAKLNAALYKEKPVADENGFVKMEALEKILDGPCNGTKRKRMERILVEDLIQVMKEMNLCYEVAAQDKRYDKYGLFIPATLRNRADEDKMIKWQVEPSDTDLSLICYVGHRLQCEDEEQTFLTQGFFPRVQVEFMKRFESNANCVVKHNIISLRYDGKETIVEYCGKSTPTTGYDLKDGYIDVLVDGYIDVLVRSSKSKPDTSVFTKHVLRIIKDVCTSANFGCPGVVLVESILNPRFVEKPSGTRDRKDQAVRVNDLIRFVKSKFDMFGSEEPFNLDYDHEWPSPGGSSKAQDLLGDDEWQGLIMECFKELAVEVNKQHQALEEVQAEVSFPPDDDKPEDLTTINSNENDLIGLDPQNVFLYKTIKHLEEQVKKIHRITRAEFHHRFDAVDETSRQMSDKLDKILMFSEKTSEQVEENTKLQRKLFLHISRNIEKVMDFSIHLQNSRVPRLMYFTDADNMTRLVTSFVPGLKSVQVHLMCEHIEGVHLVSKQKGCELRYTSERFQSALPYVIWGVRAISLLVKIGGIAIGAGVGSFVEGAEKELIKALASSIPLNVVSSNVDEGCVSRAVLPEDLKEKQKAAEQWLVDFLSGKSIPDLFDLHRIRYTSGSKRLAWVCGEHKREGERNKSMEIVPA